jgi:hypothetical protein
MGIYTALLQTTAELDLVSYYKIVHNASTSPHRDGSLWLAPVCPSRWTGSY